MESRDLDCHAGGGVIRGSRREEALTSVPLLVWKTGRDGPRKGPERHQTGDAGEFGQPSVRWSQLCVGRHRTETGGRG